MHGDCPRDSCIARRPTPWSVSTHVAPSELRTLHVRSYHGGANNPPAALDSSAAWNNNAEQPSLNPAEVLQRLRAEKAKYNSPLQRLAERWAPQDDLEKMKLNWVGDIDRHQRKLFWMLIEMLCVQIAPILWACRAVHDFIIATQTRIRFVVDEARTKWIPGLVLASKSAAVHAVKGARIAAREFVVASIATVRAGGQARAMLRQREVRSAAANGGAAAVNGGVAAVIGSQHTVLAQTVQLAEAVAAPLAGGARQETGGIALGRGEQPRSLGEKASVVDKEKAGEVDEKGLKGVWNKLRSFDIIL